ncbi:MAG: hypothetical protein P1T08_05895 [Acidimicrobiia bacterium]|nr:hypothetical protein [Acidimicrobiia bacterium]
MIRRFLLMLTVLALAGGCSSTPSTTTIADIPTTTTTFGITSTIPEPTTTTLPQAALEIRAAFDGYVAALAAADGRSALSYVDSGTLDLYGELLQLAAAPVHVDEMDFIDAVLVVRLRFRFSEQELALLTAEDVFVTAIDEALLISTPGERINFDAFNITDDQATGEVRGSPAMWFAREDGKWKVALGRAYEEYAPVLSVQLEQAAHDIAGADAGRADSLLGLLSTIEGTGIDPALLAGPRP